MRLLHRPELRRWLRWRPIQLLLLILTVFLTVDLFIVLPIARRARQRHAALAVHRDPKPSFGKIYITAAMTNRASLIGSKWRDSVVELVKLLGPENVYVSVVESGSVDETYLELAKLNIDLMTLGAMRRLVHGDKPLDQEIRDVFPEDGPHWVEVGGKGKQMRRIPWLAHIRNRQLEPMYEMEEIMGWVYDRVVFLNDIWFEAEDVVRLLNTRGGNYSAVCGLDYLDSKGAKGLYDTFATRDMAGWPIFTPRYPYFARGPSKDALEEATLIPVRSCWGGVTILDGAPFQVKDKAARLKFRALGDSYVAEHLEASEWCLLHQDNPLTTEKGVWINPSVRTGHSEAAYRAVHGSNGWPSTREVRNGVWQNTLMYVLNLPWRDVKIRPAYARWLAGGADREEEVGYDCLVDDEQVIGPDGWNSV